MQISFLELRDKDVVNVVDGKKLGKIHAWAKKSSMALMASSMARGSWNR